MTCTSGETTVHDLCNSVLLPALASFALKFLRRPVQPDENGTCSECVWEKKTDNASIREPELGKARVIVITIAVKSSPRGPIR